MSLNSYTLPTKKCLKILPQEWYPIYNQRPRLLKKMTQKMHDLHTFMAQVTDEMASEYKRIYAKTSEDPGTAGDEGEENWAQLLREWLPATYHVATKGRLIASDGSMSPQIDVLVLKPFYPSKLREKKVWIAGGVAAVFECKTTLRAQHISAERCQKFKKLFPHRKGTPATELRSPLIYGILAHSHDWKAPASSPCANVTSALNSAIAKADKPSELIDLVCIADVGCWINTVITFYQATWAENSEQLKSEFGGDWGPATAMSAATLQASAKGTIYHPIGAMIAILTQRLAWEDPSVRDLADYYRLANLWGDGSGDMRFWKQSCLSDEVIQKINSGGLTNGQDWGEWNAGII